MPLTPEQQQTLDAFAALGEEARASLIDKAVATYGFPVEGEVYPGGNAPGVIPPSGRIDPQTGAPVVEDPEPEPEPGSGPDPYCAPEAPAEGAPNLFREA